MATKSILKTIKIREKNMGRNFVNALETSQTKIHTDVELRKKCRELKGEDIQKVFQK